MPEYIERESVVAELSKGTIVTDDIYGMGMMTGLGYALNAVRAIPAADVAPVVRCKDCKLWHEETGFCEKHSFFIDSDGVCCSPAESPEWTMTGPDDFCSYGERK